MYSSLKTVKDCNDYIRYLKKRDPNKVTLITSNHEETGIETSVWVTKGEEINMVKRLIKAKNKKYKDYDNIEQE